MEKKDSEKNPIKEIEKSIKTIKKNKSIIWDIAKKALGFIFLFLGLLGMLLPLFPGLPLVILGFLLIGNDTIKKYILNLIEQTKKAKSATFKKLKK